MKIDKNFVSGNIEVLKINGDVVTLERELRDSAHDWFYWAFRVCDAAKRTITFRFPHEMRVGYWGAAYSHDLIHWHWTGKRELGVDEEGISYESFTYTFDENENEVYFAHNMIYLPEHFNQFCAENNLPIEEFCVSNKGRSVPYIHFGNGEKKILLTSRHHCCESPGSYVLESVAKNLLDNPIEGFEVCCVPFVDYDGVVDGDQGKHRAPHDHNRDYPLDGSKSIYTTCAKLREYADENQIVFAFDFHAPKHLGAIDSSDKAYMVYNVDEDIPLFDKFSAIFQSKITSDAIAYDSANNYYPNVGWNKSTNATFARYMTLQPENHLAFTFETPYFGEEDGSVLVNQNTLRAFGKCFADALREYIREMF